VNILITSAGRRTSLMLAFQKAARPLGLKVFAADLDPLAPACLLADAAFPVPRVTDPGYGPALLHLCRQWGVGLIVPTIDPELPILARQTAAFAAEGIVPLLSSPGFIDLCRDKWRLVQVLRAQAIDVPASWLPAELPETAALTLPERLFLKPRDGSASLNTYPCHREQLARTLRMVPNALVQECLAGPEITVDALLDFQGRPIHYVPRERIRTQGGESTQGVTLDLPDLDRWIERVLAVCSPLGARGPITIQGFLTGRGPVLTEINPRFGGGFPLALAAGADYPAWILALLGGQPVPSRLGQYRRGLFMTRHFTEIFLDTLPWPL